MKSRSAIWLSALEELGAQCSVDTARDAERVARRAAQEGDEFFFVTLPQYVKDLEKSLAYEGIPAPLFAGWRRRTRSITVVHDDCYDNGDVYSFDPLYRFEIGGGIPQFLGGFLEPVFDDERVISESQFRLALGDIAGEILHDPKTRVPRELRPQLSAWLEPKLHDRLRSQGNETHKEYGADRIAAVRQLGLMFSKEKEKTSPAREEKAIRDFVDTDEELINPFEIGSGLHSFLRRVGLLPSGR